VLDLFPHTSAFKFAHASANDSSVRCSDGVVSRLTVAASGPDIRERVFSAHVEPVRLADSSSLDKVDKGAHTSAFKFGHGSANDSSLEAFEVSHAGTSWLPLPYRGRVTGRSADID
jgi:hypothetical protein